MNSKLREAIPDIVHRHGLTLDHELREGKTIGEAENTATTEAEKAIRQAVAEEMLEILPKKSHTAQKAYRVESNDYVSVVEEKAANKKLDQVRQKIKEWAALKEPSK